MFATLVAACVMPAQAPLNCDGVCVSDAYRFGVPVECVRPLWLLARNHSDRMRETVQAWNNPADVERWAVECGWRCQCWDQLDNALFHFKAEPARLSALLRLRELIGWEAYYAGVMPKPTPSYRPWSDRYFAIK